MEISGWNNAKGHITLWNGRENHLWIILITCLIAGI